MTPLWKYIWRENVGDFRVRQCRYSHLQVNKTCRKMPCLFGFPSIKVWIILHPCLRVSFSLQIHQRKFEDCSTNSQLVSRWARMFQVQWAYSRIRPKLLCQFLPEYETDYPPKCCVKARTLSFFLVKISSSWRIEKKKSFIHSKKKSPIMSSTSLCSPEKCGLTALTM